MTPLALLAVSGACWGRWRDQWPSVALLEGLSSGGMLSWLMAWPEPGRLALHATTAVAAISMVLGITSVAKAWTVKLHPQLNQQQLFSDMGLITLERAPETSSLPSRYPCKPSLGLV